MSEKFRNFIGVATGVAVLIPFFTVIMAIVLIPAVLIWGYVGSILWGWFVVPILDAPVITVAETIGLMIVVRFVSIMGTNTTENPYLKEEPIPPGLSNIERAIAEVEAKQKKRIKLLQGLVHLYVLPWVILGIGFILKSKFIE